MPLINKNSPIISTIRPFTEHEMNDKRNSILSGVRTYYFDTFHLRGLPDVTFEGTDWEETAWVPKTDMNKFLTRERFKIFNGLFSHR